MNELFEKFEYRTTFCESWHIRKKLLEDPYYDNQMLQFYEYGYVRCRRNGEEPLNVGNIRHQWGIYFITGGTCVCRQANGSSELKKNDLLLLAPNSASQFTVTGGSTLEARKLFFMDTPAVHILTAKLFQEKKVHISSPEEVSKIFDGMENTLLAPSKLELRDLSIALYALLAEIARQCPDRESGLTMDSVRTELECSPWNNYDIPLLAKKCGLSTRTFQRKFKSAMGVSFLAYLTSCKINLACRLLRNKEYSLKEIIRMCNFRSHAYFYRIFRNATGVSPGMYRSTLSGDRNFRTGLGDIRRHAPAPDELTDTRKNILWHIMGNGRISLSRLAEVLSLHRSAVQKNIQYLKKHGFLSRSGSARAGRWIIAEKYKRFFTVSLPCPPAPPGKRKRSTCRTRKKSRTAKTSPVPIQTETK